MGAVIFELGWWDEPDLAVQATVVEPVDVATAISTSLIDFQPPLGRITGLRMQYSGVDSRRCLPMMNILAYKVSDRGQGQSVFLFTGFGSLIFGHWVQHEPAWHWLTNWPIVDIGNGLLTTGLLGVAWQYVDGQDGDVRGYRAPERRAGRLDTGHARSRDLGLCLDRPTSPGWQP